MSTTQSEIQVEDEEADLSNLDPDQLSDSDKLERKARVLRGDELFDLPVIDWERENDAVLVTVVKPNGKTEEIQTGWPDKPTKSNTFIATCMCALDVDDAQTAALMADELQDANSTEHTVPVDKEGLSGWDLKPGAEIDIDGEESKATSESCPTVLAIITFMSPLFLVASVVDIMRGNVPSGTKVDMQRNAVAMGIGCVMWIGLFSLIFVT